MSNTNSLSGFMTSTFNGGTGAGRVSISGLEVGDFVLGVWRTDAGNQAAFTNASGVNGPFESVISGNGGIYQNDSSDLSSNNYLALTFRSLYNS